MSYTKVILSGSTNGRQIEITETSTPGTVIHVAVPGSENCDEVYLYATNGAAVDENLTIEWGGVSSPDDLIQMAIPALSGLYLIVPGLVLQNGLTIRAFAGSADVLFISGWVNRITA